MHEDVRVRPTMEREDDIVKAGRTLIGMDVEHRERDFIQNLKINGKPVKTGKGRGNMLAST